LSSTRDLAPLQRNGLAPVWARIREHLERYGWSTLGSITLDLDADPSLALAGLMGSRRLRTGPVRIPLGRLDSALRSSRLEVGLVEALEAMGGPLTDRRQLRRIRGTSETQMWERLQGRAQAVRPELSSWLAKMRHQGIARRVAGEEVEEVLERVLVVVSQLPAKQVPLQRLAVTVGSAHELDWDRPIGSLTLSALAHLRGQTPPNSSLRRRQLWAEFGVVLDSLSATVLALNLRPEGDGLAASILRACAELGEPTSLTLGQLKRDELTFAVGHPPVLICENPTVMEEVKACLGAVAPPMVCVAGRFNTAGAVLLEHLSKTGVALRYHGDFDYSGIAIANEVMARFGAEPWKFDTASYLRALEISPGHPPEGRRVEASWDPHLATAIAHHKRAIHEEAVVEELLCDLEVS